MDFSQAQRFFNESLEAALDEAELKKSGQEEVSKEKGLEL